MIRQTGSDATGPSRSVAVLGPLSRRINRQVMRIAGRRRSGPLVEIHHVGRRSGKPYIRPVLARPVGRTYLIPLFFGAGADWCRNVQKADGCRLKSRASIHQLHNPRVVPTADAKDLVRAAFHAHERAALKFAGIKAYLLLDIDPAASPIGS